MKNEDTLSRLGFTYSEINALKRLSRQLHRWYELECGIDTGGVERDEDTGKCYWYNSFTGRRSPTPDRETGALKRLAALMANHPHLNYYLQTDPRGGTIYILRPGDIPEGKDTDQYYNRGVLV